MRGLTKLKDRGAITPVGKTHLGVIKYSLGGLSSDTCPKSDTGLRSDTCISSDTGGGPKSDTSPVSDLIHIKHNLKENTINTSYSTAKLERDALLFLKLWQKWNDQNLTKWKASDPVKQYISLSRKIVTLWKKRGNKKSLEHELTILDVFLMQKHIDLGKDYSGPPRFWAGEKWVSGLEKWLSSPTPSHTGGNRKQLLPYAIKITVEDTPAAGQEKELEGPSSEQKWYLESLSDMLEAYEFHQDKQSLQDAVEWLYDDMRAKLSSAVLQDALKEVQTKLQETT